MINLGRLIVTGGGLGKSPDNSLKKKKKRIERLKVCHVASNQSACHQCFLLLCVNTIGESLIEHEYWHGNNITMLSGIRRVVWATWYCQGQKERRGGVSVPLRGRLSKWMTHEDTYCCWIRPERDWDTRQSIRIGTETFFSLKEFSTVGQIKQMSRIVCCYIRWSSLKLFDTKLVTTRPTVRDIISVKCKLACCSDDWNVQIHSTWVIPLHHPDTTYCQDVFFVTLVSPFGLQRNTFMTY